MTINTEELESIIFKNATEKVRNWMTQTYPDLTKKLYDKVFNMTESAEGIEEVEKRISHRFQETEKLYKEMIAKFESVCEEIYLDRKKARMETIEASTSEIKSLFKGHSELLGRASVSMVHILDCEKKSKDSFESIYSMHESARKLLEEIETKFDGFQKSTSIFRDIYNLRDEVGNISQQFHNMQNGLRSIFEKKEETIDLTTPLDFDEFSMRTSSILQYAKINTIKDLLDTPNSDLLKLRNCGKKVIQEIESYRERIKKKHGIS